MCRTRTLQDSLPAGSYQHVLAGRNLQLIIYVAQQNEEGRERERKRKAGQVIWRSQVRILKAKQLKEKRVNIISSVCGGK